MACKGCYWRVLPQRLRGQEVVRPRIRAPQACDTDTLQGLDHTTHAPNRTPFSPKSTRRAPQSASLRPPPNGSICDARAGCSNRSASMLCPAWRQRKASRLAIKEFSPARDNCTAPTILSISPSVLAYMGRPLSRPLWALLENDPLLSSCRLLS